MYNVSIPMALVDYIPVILFGISAVILQKDLHNKMRPLVFSLFSGGTLFIFFAGLLKATWKLLYASCVCDFAVFNEMMLPLQSIGFVLTALGLLLMNGKNQTAKLATVVIPPVFGGTFIFIMMMVLGLGTICTSLSVLSVKLKKGGAIAIFVLTFLCYMCMGYMSSQDSTLAVTNWIEEGINCVGQALLLSGVVVLHKAGLKDYAAAE